MATSREERMQQRMRGAGRHEVADESFGFVLPEEDSPEGGAVSPTLLARSEPNTSAKRRRLNPDAEADSAQQVSPTRSSRVSIRSSADRASSAPAVPDQVEEDEDPTDVTVLAPVEVDEAEIGEDTLESLPEVVQPISPQGSLAASRLSVGPLVAEEVTESPADAPGSGHRRRVRLSSVATQSAKLQRAVMVEESGATGLAPTSSPLERKARQSAATPSILSARPPRASAKVISQSPTEEGDDLSSPIPGAQRAGATIRQSLSSPLQAEDDELSSPLQETSKKARKPSQRGRSKLSTAVVADEAEEDHEEEAEDEIAEEVDITEVVQRVGRGNKRQRPSPPAQESPELDSRLIEEEPPAKKRRQKRPQGSPAKQSQPKPPKNPKPSKRRQGDGEAIPVTVQRYNRLGAQEEDGSDEDPLNSDIPFANRSGVNIVDVLAQICEEVIGSSIDALFEAATNAEDSSTKKEYRTKLRALEAFQEELRTRLLEHTIALDTMHALQKRVRSMQKEKLALRNDILRIRAEREQVALKMDAVRIRHETESKDSMQQLNLSAAMHDIDLAVERGNSAPNLASKDQKSAELSNLELLIARITSQACSTGDGGGTLKQVTHFNAFLERAAVALEGR